jgi:hypothetical protein
MRMKRWRTLDGIAPKPVQSIMNIEIAASPSRRKEQKCRRWTWDEETSLSMMQYDGMFGGFTEAIKLYNSVPKTEQAALFTDKNQ